MNAKRMLDEFVELATIDSASGKEAAIAEVLVPKLEELGFTVTRDQAGETFGGECGNVLAVLEGELEGALMLSSHMDRVPNGLGIHPVERDGVLYSDGTTILAADDLSGVCAILEGMRQLLEEKVKLPRIEIVFSVGEEAGLFGAFAMDMSWFQAKDAFIFDSPGGVGRFINAAPGRYQLGAEVTGLSAHAGNAPEKGIDAARIMCEMMSTLKQGRINAITTSNFPILSSGTKVPNVVCDFATFSGEARSQDIKELEAYVEYFKAHCQEVAEKYGAQVKLNVEAAFMPFRLADDCTVLTVARETCQAMGLDCRIEMGGGGMDANVYNDRGMSCVGVATGYSKNHTPNEQLVLDDFYKSGDLARGLIETYAGTCKAK